MNWTKLKTDYPNAFPDIREFSRKAENRKFSSDIIMRRFLESKGYRTHITWIYALREYEKLKNQKIN